MRRVLVLVTVAALVGLLPGSAVADDNNKVQAVPFTFVGTAAECSPSPAGSRIVTAAWLGGMGLPDNGGPNATTPNDPHTGLLLSKNGPTADCSSSGARITGVQGMTVDAAFTLGFEYRNGGHCGAGAPRFNVVAKLGTAAETFHFVGGCSNETTPIGATQDPTQWTRVMFQTSNPAESFPVIPVGSKIVSISILYDEGTDTANNDTQGVGLAVIDNIWINGKLITSGPSG
ncbi:MAG TPA: hypothetical protein VI056_07405, partial [Candidatus Limnocylindria bacterium]